MSKQVVCDGCGKIIATKLDRHNHGYGFATGPHRHWKVWFKVEFFADYDRNKEFDICETCAKYALASFLDSEIQKVIGEDENAEKEESSRKATKRCNRSPKR